MKAYASRTGTKDFLGPLRDAGWGLLISAYGEHRDEGFEDIMLDNGAWSAHTTGKPWKPALFEALLDKFGEASSQTVVPDIVAGGQASLDLSLAWLPRLLELRRPVLLVAQDGMTPDDLRPHLGEIVGVAVGGSGPWKWNTLCTWCQLGREVGCRVHVLRANSGRMASWSKACGAYSIDGSGPSKYGPDCLRRIDAGRTKPAQRPLLLDLPPPFTPRTT